MTNQQGVTTVSDQQPRLTEVTMQQVLDALQQTAEGRTQLELATQRAVIQAQRAESEALSNGQVTVGADDYDIHDD